jgi:membrane protein DedA with SNARE-associated domain
MAAEGALVGLPTATGLLVAMEAGVPVPIPSDLVMLGVGERVGTGHISLAAAVLAFELVAVVGTTALFLVCRGPGRALISRVGRWVGLTPARLERARQLLSRRGRGALAVGRATPGLRTVTVVTAASADLRPRRALPALIAGSTVFVQVHLLLGFAVGASARATLQRFQGEVPYILVALAVVGAVVWGLRRRSRAGARRGWSEAACPACLAVALLIPEDDDRNAVNAT